MVEIIQALIDSSAIIFFVIFSTFILRYIAKEMKKADDLEKRIIFNKFDNISNNLDELINNLDEQREILNKMESRLKID